MAFSAKKKQRKKEQEEDQKGEVSLAANVFGSESFGSATLVSCFGYAELLATRI